MRGFLQAHPNGSAAFVHRVSSSKFDLWNDDPRMISHVTLPSCGYFQKRGWHPVVVPSEHFAPWVLRNSGAEAGLKGSLAAALTPAGRPAAVACPFDTHTLYGASRRCARYDYNSAAGDKRLPLFEVRSSGSQQEVWQRQRCVQLGSLCAAQMWLE